MKMFTKARRFAIFDLRKKLDLKLDFLEKKTLFTFGLLM
jgi:hypothetical protein